MLGLYDMYGTYMVCMVCSGPPREQRGPEEKFSRMRSTQKFSTN